MTGTASPAALPLLARDARLTDLGFCRFSF